MIEESHAHTKIDGNNDVNVVLEFQVKEDPNDQIKNMHNTRDTFNSDL